MNDETLMSNIQTVNEMLARQDISPYARAALERLLTDLTSEIANRAKQRS